MYFSETLQGSKSAITMHPVSVESTLLLFLLIYIFLIPTLTSFYYIMNNTLLGTQTYSQSVAYSKS